MTSAERRFAGRLEDRSAVRSVRFDDFVATYVVDGILRMRPKGFFPAIPSHHWSARPELLTADGELLMSVGGLLIERDDTVLLIDAGVGPAQFDFSVGSADSGSMIDVLTDLGWRPERIDMVAITHLHFDHAGWLFANGAETFPNARHVLAAQEWAPHRTGEHRADLTTPQQVVSHLATKNTLDLFDDGDEILPGVRAIVTPGHSPGHTSYVITSQTGQRLIALGDAFHIPAQLAHPDWLSMADVDAEGVLTARRRLLGELSQDNTVGFAFHFGDQAFGRVVTGDAGEPIWEPVETSVLAPPPR